MIVYRQADATDADAIAHVHTQSWQKYYAGELDPEYLKTKAPEERRSLWRERFIKNDSDLGVWLAQENETCAGFVCFCAGADNSPADVLLDNLHVLDSYQRRGIGIKLIREAGDWLQRHYADASVYLWVFESNRNEQDFYKSLGAVETTRALISMPYNKSVPGVRLQWDNPGALLSGIS